MNKSRDKWIITVYFSIFCFWGDLVVSASFIPAQEEINCWGRQKERWGKEEAVEGERGKEDSWIHLSVLSLPLGISLLAKDMWRLQHFQTSAMPMNCELVCMRAVFYLWLVCTQTYRYTPYICWWLMCKSEPWYLCNHKASLQVYISLCVLTWECMFANVCSAIFACLSACVSVCVCVCVCVWLTVLITRCFTAVFIITVVPAASLCLCAPSLLFLRLDSGFLGPAELHQQLLNKAHARVLKLIAQKLPKTHNDWHIFFFFIYGEVGWVVHHFCPNWKYLSNYLMDCHVGL